jgi:NADH-quinone oxidoreductase subunit A
MFETYRFQELSPYEPGVASLAVYAVLILALAAFLLFLSGWLGEKNPTAEKTSPYECGLESTGIPPFHHPVPFYPVAVFFVVFDVEAAFIFSWAIAFEPLGLVGWLRISFFIAVLLVGLAYIWKKGGLEWRVGAIKRLEHRNIPS